MKKVVFIVSLLFIVVGCQEEKSTSWEVAEKDESFEVVVSPKSYATELGAVISIDSWQLTDSVLWCKTNLNEAFFYRFTLSDFALIDSLGVKGNGPDELIAPHLASLNAHSYLIADNGKRKITLYEDERVTKSYPFPAGILLFPQIYKLPYAGYIEQTPNKLAWRLLNLETSEVCDSICFIDEERKANSEDDYFHWKIWGDRLVILSMYHNRFGVGHIVDHKIVERRLYKGSDRFEQRKCYYSAVACSEDYICLLSQKHVDEKSASGYSTVEVYDYNGTPQALLKLDFIADGMLLDFSHNRILFTSPLDDLIHWVGLPDD